MKIEKWKYNNQEIDVPILDEDEIETNEDIEELEKTIDLTAISEVIGENREQ